MDVRGLQFKSCVISLEPQRPDSATKNQDPKVLPFLIFHQTTTCYNKVVAPRLENSLNTPPVLNIHPYPLRKHTRKENMRVWLHIYSAKRAKGLLNINYPHFHHFVTSFQTLQTCQPHGQLGSRGKIVTPHKINNLFWYNRLRVFIYLFNNDLYGIRDGGWIMLGHTIYNTSPQCLYYKNVF